MQYAPVPADNPVEHGAATYDSGLLARYRAVLVPWLAGQLDCVALWHGLGLLLLALPCRRLALRARALGQPAAPWLWLGGLALPLIGCQWLGGDCLWPALVGGVAVCWLAVRLRRGWPEPLPWWRALAAYGLILLASALTHGTAQIVARYVAAAMALGLSASTWSRWRQGFEVEISSLGRRPCWVMATVFAGCLVAGWMLTLWRGQLADTELRGELRQRVLSLARAIHPPRLQALSFTAADEEAPTYIRLCEQLRSYHAFMGGARGFYTVAPRGRELVFGPESYTRDDPQSSRPGTVYERPSPELQRAFGLRTSLTVGPYRDEYGEFLSGYAPVVEARSGNVLAMVGVDLEADVWRRALASARREGLLCTLLVALALTAGFYLLHLRAELGEGRAGWLAQGEVWSTLGLGASLTLVLSASLYQYERLAAANAFEHLASASAEALIAQCEALRLQMLATARLLSATPGMAQPEFEKFVQPFATSGAPAWAYAPTSTDAGGQQHLRIALVAPHAAARGWLDTDLLAEPTHHQSVARALATGLLCGSAEPGSADPPTYRAFQAVGTVGHGRPSGMVVCRFSPQALVETVMSRSQADQGLMRAALLDVSDLRDTGGHGRSVRAQSFDRIYAVNLLGRAWVVLISPANTRVASRPLRAFLTMLLIGLAMTGLVAYFVALLVNRQHDLERQVRDRTAALARREEGLRGDLRRSLHQQQVLAELAMRPEVLSGDLLGAARICCEYAAITLGTARASVWVLPTDRSHVECIDAYDTDRGTHSQGQILPYDQVEPLIAAAREVRVLASAQPNFGHLLRGAAHNHVAEQHLSALLTTLVRVAGQDRAALLLSHRGSSHQWLPDELTFCSQLADQLSLTITNRERLEAQAVLDRSKREVETILQSLQTCVLVIDAESHTIIDANPAACQLINVPRQSLIGQVCHQHICPGDEGGCPVHDMCEQVHNSERMLLTSDGREVPVLKTVARLRLGDRACVLESFVDISAQREQQAQLSDALSESERMLRLMVDREERIIEMKREVNELLSRLGGEPRYAAGLAEVGQ